MSRRLRRFMNRAINRALAEAWLESREEIQRRYGATMLGQVWADECLERIERDLSR